MPLNIRSIAVSIAVIWFFGIAAIGWLVDLSPFTCCKRALIGAVFAYIIAACGVKVINTILINAMTKHQMDQQKEKVSDHKD